MKPNEFAPFVPRDMPDPLAEPQRVTVLTKVEMPVEPELDGYDADAVFIVTQRRATLVDFYRGRP